jgi:Tfp pilus assembly protein PilN
MRARLNLASRPFRNETLPALLLGAGVTALLVLTVLHALAVRRLLPDRTTRQHKEVAALEQEVARIRGEAAALTGPGPERGTLERWALFKELVDRRSFGWTELLARLEQVLPREIRLVSIEPRWERGQLNLQLTAATRAPESGFEFARVLEQSGPFEEVYPVSKSESSGVFEFRYAMRYHLGAARPAAAAGGEAAGEPAPEDEGGDTGEDAEDQDAEDQDAEDQDADADDGDPDAGQDAEDASALPTPPARPTPPGLWRRQGRPEGGRVPWLRPSPPAARRQPRGKNDAEQS